MSTYDEIKQWVKATPGESVAKLRDQIVPKFPPKRVEETPLIIPPLKSDMPKGQRYKGLKGMTPLSRKHF